MTRILFWVIPALFLLIIAPFTPALDLSISKYFYQDDHFRSSAFINFFYLYGFVPADFLVLVGVLIFFLSPEFTWLKPYRAAAAFFALTGLIGALLIVHVIFKDHWGRPRPVQTVQFGGTHHFRPFYQPNFHLHSKLKSFPCGHCSTGFIFFTLIFMGWRHRSKLLFWFGILFTIAMSASLSYGRLAQGGHYFSDVLVAGLIMWWTTLAMDWLVYDKLKLDQK